MVPLLNVGRIPFLVCAPFFHRSLNGLPGITFRDASPAQQNALLREARIDLSPTSSLEYALRPESYVLLPGLCTAGRLEIRSVRLFSQVPWTELGGKVVRLSQASATSNALFRILSRQAYGVKPKEQLPGSAYSVGETRSESLFGEAMGEVAIGDEALRLAQSGTYTFSYDLAVEWMRWQNLPFAFGLWLVRREIAESENMRATLSGYADQVRGSVQAFLADPQTALAAWLKVYPSTLPMADILDFYSSADYALTEAHAQSLRLFFTLARQEGLVERVPDLRFFQA
jgi:chorismate dehydratase